MSEHHSTTSARSAPHQKRMTAQLIAIGLKGKKSGSGWKACCPAHDDRSPSLSISEGDDGPIWNCLGGCTKAEVTAALVARNLWGGWKNSSTKPAPKRSTKPHATPDWMPMVPPPANAPEPSPASFRGFSKTYEYRSQAGEPLFYIRRKEATATKAKEFMPLTFGSLTDSKTGEIITGWHSRHANAPRPLYGLNRLVARPDAPVMLCEGEKDADAAAILFPDYVAMAWPGGSLAVIKTDWTPLLARNVIMFPDADAPGAKAAKEIQGFLPHVRIVRVDDLPKGQGAADLEMMADEAAAWLQERLQGEVDGSAERAVEDQGEPAGFLDEEPREDEQVLILTPGAPLNSARQFIAREHTSQNMRTLHHQNSTFFAWEQSHYIENTPDEMRARLYPFLDKAKRINDDNEAVNFDPTKSKVANIMEATAAVSQLSQAIRPPAWLNNDANNLDAADVMSCTNGLVNLTTRAMQPHSPAFFTLNALDYAYDDNAPEPVAWLKFLNDIWPNDPKAIETLQEIFGLSLTGETRYQKAFLIVGPKRSGKGTLARVLTQLLGAANVCGPTLSNLSQNFGIAPLIGKRLAIISDARLGGKADQQVIVERILAITGEDSLTVDRKNRDAWTGQLGVRFVILTNELPRLSDTSGALAGRFIVLTMSKSFYGNEDLALTQKLTSELPGILKWALDGWDRLKARKHFVQPESSAQAQKEMEDLGSPVGAFLRDVCVVDTGVCVRTDDLYQRWCAWCREQGRDHPGTVQTFGRDLGSAVPGLGITQPRAGDNSRHRYYSGVGLNLDEPARIGTRSTASYPAFDSPLPECPPDHMSYPVS